MQQQSAVLCMLPVNLSCLSSHLQNTSNNNNKSSYLFYITNTVKKKQKEINTKNISTFSTQTYSKQFLLTSKLEKK